MASPNKIYATCATIDEALTRLQNSIFPNIQKFGTSQNHHFVEKALAHFRQYDGTPYSLDHFDQQFSQFLQQYLSGIGIAGQIFMMMNDPMTLQMSTHDIVVATP